MHKQEPLRSICLYKCIVCLFVFCHLFVPPLLLHVLIFLADSVELVDKIQIIQEIREGFIRVDDHGRDKKKE